jgi:hypothetical protein
LIYLDACALLKFIKSEQETEALRAWRQAFGIDHQRVLYVTGQALRGVYLVDLTSTVLARAMSYRLPRLGSLDAIHLATADPFRTELTEFVTYDHELTTAAADLGFPVATPS